MKKFISEVKAGVQRAPALLIFIYILLGIFDLITTYMASPDLKYESNWVVKKFNFNWATLIIYAVINYFIIISLFVFSLNYLSKYFHIKSLGYFKFRFQKIKFLLSILMIGLFYSHFLSLAHVLINNFLGFIYLRENLGPQWLNDIANNYIPYQKYFIFYLKYILYIPGFIITYFKVKNIRSKSIVYSTR